MPLDKVKLDSRLTRTLDTNAQEELVQRYKSSREIREAFVRVLTDSYNDAIIKSESDGVYASPNALAVLSDLAGYRRGLREAIKLLTDKE